MLTFLYTADYDLDTDRSDSLPLQLHAQMYSLADKYQIPALMQLATKKYKQVLQIKPTFKDYFLSIPDIYTPQTSGTELRALVVDYARRYLGRALGQEHLRTSLLEIIDEVPEYGFDVIETFAEAPIRGKCFSCGPDQGADPLQARCRKCGRGGVSDTY
jgi:speckle-type POZ protein